MSRKFSPCCPGDHVTVGPYELTLDKVEPRPGPNYDETVAHMTIRSGGNAISTIEPSRKFYRARQMTTTDAGLRTFSLGQIYAVVTEQNSNGEIDVRLYWKPYVALIWIGAIIMAWRRHLARPIVASVSASQRRARQAAMQPAE